VDFYFIGDDELVTAFRFIGINGTAVKDAEEAVTIFRSITEGSENFISTGEASEFTLPVQAAGCQVLLLTEETADWLGDYMINWQLSGRYPLLVEIPGISGRHTNRKTLVEQIREAIGIHV
jgi:V/A-type H+-transporting ATPase subunit F